MPHRGILVVVTLWMGCAGDGSSTTDTDTGTALAACVMAAEEMTCPSCTDGPARCTFGEVEVVRGSCGICQSRSQLLQELCDAGEPATRADLEAGITCEMASATTP